MYELWCEFCLFLTDLLNMIMYSLIKMLPWMWIVESKIISTFIKERLKWINCVTFFFFILVLFINSFV